MTEEPMTTDPSPAAIVGRPAAIVVAGLTKSYGKQAVLRGLDLRVPAGSVYALLGPNGAGKTTLVRILTTLLRPDGGTAHVAGIDVARRPRAARHAVGLVGQHAALDEILTGRQNLELFARLFHLGPDAARRRAGELLDAFALRDAADRPVAGYSGGMRRRLDLAAGLLAHPSVLFLDEPTTGLDPRGRAEVWEAVRDLVADGTTVLLTTQYLEEADRLADRVGILDDGRIVAEGTPRELKSGLGADRVELVLADAARLTDARDLLARALGPDAGGTRSGPHGAGPDADDDGLGLDGGGIGPNVRDTSSGDGDTHIGADGGGIVPDIGDIRLDADRATLSLPAPEGLATLAAVVAALATDPTLVTEDVALRRPSLDEVFLSLTAAPPSASMAAPAAIPPAAISATSTAAPPSAPLAVPSSTPSATGPVPSSSTPGQEA